MNGIHFYSMGRALAPSEWHFNKFTRTNRLYVVYGGDAWFMDNGKKRALTAGRLYLFPYQFPVLAYQNPEDRLDHLYFDFSIVPPLLSSKVIELSVACDPVISNIIAALSVLITETPLDEELIRPLFLGLFTRVCNIGKGEQLEDTRLSEVLRCIHEEYQAPLPNSRLAAMVHLDVNHFIRIFKRATGLTPRQYIIGHRLNIATALIIEGKSIESVAQSVGFDDSASLCHAMKKHRGFSPGEILKR